ncbi:hypothetical protein SAMN04489835_0570 [Mycolicibacterium rutilum]|uniref:PE-PPE domain-containing protein n=1 Tax=Mycolicibacterium rutilum TaxID=370526 RepID=A0A1H6IQX6_MYCRU|nr:hypothetical protein [Mycolicibacterium rutilum]SEH49946.1 hypothetical protein SAMN04489835_0570 [Mycolicibacterium rutilum]
MNAFARPSPTKLAAAVLTAGVVASTAIVEVPEHRAPAAITADVANASVVTDMLYNFGDIVAGAMGAYTAYADAQTSLPFDISTATLIALENPSLGPSLFSWFVQRYLNPSDAYPAYTYPWDIKDSIELIAGTFPPPIGGAIIAGLNQFADAIGAAFANTLPDSAPGVSATDFFWEQTTVGRTVWAANLAAVAPLYVTYNVVSFLGYLPATLEATFESALRDPSEIPGLLSYLAYGLFSNTGLLGGIVEPIAHPFIALPGPIGDFSQQVVNAFFNGIAEVLSLLPPPVAPTPFPTQVTADVEGFAADETISGDEPGLRAMAAEEAAADSEGEETPEPGADEVTSPPPADDSAPAADPGPDLTPNSKVKSGNKFVPGETLSTPDGTESPAATDPVAEPTEPAEEAPTGADAGETDTSTSDPGEASGQAA